MPALRDDADAGRRRDDAEDALRDPDPDRRCDDTDDVLLEPAEAEVRPAPACDCRWPDTGLRARVCALL